MTDDKLIKRIRQLPDAEPPPEMVFRIVSSLEPKQVSFWRRCFQWISTPKTITITPFKWAPAMVCILLLFWLNFIQGFDEKTVSHMGGTPSKITLTFRFDHPGARTVALVGTFNEWTPDLCSMKLDPESKLWVCRVTVAPGRYEYAFLVNGEKIMPDPSAVFTQLDGFGNYNSVIFATSQDNETI